MIEPCEPNDNLPELNNITDLFSLPRGSAAYVAIDLIRPSQSDDGAESLFWYSPIEVGYNGIIVHGNHKYYRAKDKNARYLLCTAYRSYRPG